VSHTQERSAGTDWFLARLPISKQRIFLEKVCAGLVFLLLLFVLSEIFYAATDAAILPIWEPDRNFGSFHSNLFLALFSSFVIAVGFSKFLTQPMAIFFAAFTTQIILWTSAQTLFTDVEADFMGTVIAFTYIVLCFGLPFVLAWKQWRYPLNPTVWGSPGSRTQFKGLVFKTWGYDALLNITALLLLVSALILNFTAVDVTTLESRYEVFLVENGMNTTITTFVTGFALLLLMAVGANAYTTSDGDGLNCIAYAHPVPRTQLFLSKLAAAVPIVLVVWLIAWLNYRETIPAISIGVFCVFIYITAMHMSLWMRSQLLIILGTLSGAIMAFTLTSAWMIPRGFPIYFKGFMPTYDPYLVGLIPLSLIILCSVLTAWRMATNRRFLAATEKNRAKYNLVGTLASLAAVYVVITVLPQVVVL